MAERLSRANGAAPGSGSPGWDEVYPPRARRRPPQRQLAARLRAPAARARDAGAAIRNSASAAQAHEAMETARARLLPWLHVAASVVPGLGQIQAGRRGTGLALLAAASLTCAALAWTRVGAPAWACLWILTGLVWLSLWEAAFHAFAPANETPTDSLCRSLVTAGAAGIGTLALAGLIGGIAR